LSCYLFPTTLRPAVSVVASCRADCLRPSYYPFGCPMPYEPDSCHSDSLGKVTGVWQGVAMDSLKFHLSLSCPTLLRPAGGRPAAVSYPMDTPWPHTVRLCLKLDINLRTGYESNHYSRFGIQHFALKCIYIRRGVSKRGENSGRPSALWAGHS
jgi:hypothetical protein